MKSIEQRYNEDPMIHNFVDMMERAIEELQITPSEIRECAMLAAIRYEMANTTCYVQRKQGI